MMFLTTSNPTLRRARRKLTSIYLHETTSQKEEILKRNAVSLESRFWFFLAKQKERPAGRRTAVWKYDKAKGASQENVKGQRAKTNQFVLFPRTMLR